MPFYSGQQGQLWVDDTRVAKVTSWSFQASQATLDTTCLADTDRTLIPGLRSISGGCRIFYHQSTPGGGGDVNRLLSKCVKTTATSGSGVAAESSPAKLKLLVADGSATGRYIEFPCWLTGISMAMGVGEVLSADVSFEVDGAPTGMTL